MRCSGSLEGIAQTEEKLTVFVDMKKMVSDLPLLASQTHRRQRLGLGLQALALPRHHRKVEHLPRDTGYSI